MARTAHPGTSLPVFAAALLALAGGCALAPAPARPSGGSAAPALVLAPPVEHLDLLAREPMVVEHPNGTLFVAGYGEKVPTLWASRDGGATWTRVPVGTEAEGAIGNSDVDLAMARNGTLYFATMVYDRKANEGTHISLGVSRDAGTTWSWTLLSNSRFDDRPWVEVATDGTPHVIWNDGDGVCHATSLDDGRTWTEHDRIHPQGGSSHLAVGPNGEIAVRVVPLSASGNKIHEGVDLIAVSTDGGTTWQKHPAPGRRAWIFPLSDETPLPRWVEPVAWDAGGALYSLTSNDEGLWLARSTDRGATWQSWRVAQNAALPRRPRPRRAGRHLVLRIENDAPRPRRPHRPRPRQRPAPRGPGPPLSAGQLELRPGAGRRHPRPRLRGRVPAGPVLEKRRPGRGKPGPKLQRTALRLYLVAGRGALKGGGAVPAPERSGITRRRVERS